jgi:tetratricopeptide (TPR) repeat protein
MPELPEVHELTSEEHRHDRYGRRIAIATVLTTLGAAIIAFLQASALRTHDQADARAEKLGAIAVTQSAGQRDLAQLQIDRFQLFRDDLTRANDAEAVATYSSGPATKTAAAESKRWQAVARTTNADTLRMARDDGMPAITLDGFFGPNQDPSYPNRYFERGQHRSYELFAMREAANLQAEAAEARFVHYAASLTMFAVAVFLFGYSLTPQGRARRGLFSRVAGVFVVIAAIWALVNALGKTERSSDAAATAFADGRVSSNTYDYSAAVKHFDKAIELQPKLIEAYVQRASALVTSGGALINEIPVPPAPAVDRAIKDDQHALKLGSEAPTLQRDLANVLLYGGLEHHDDAMLRESVEHGEEAAKRLPNEESGVYNAAEAKLALGDIEGAREGFKAGEERTARRSLNVREGRLASVLTDLAYVRQLRPKRGDEIDKISDELVASASAGSATAGNYTASKGMSSRRPQFSQVTTALDPGHAEVLVGSATGFDTTKDRVSAQWYYRSDPKTPWTVLSGISGPVTDFSSTAPFSTNPSYIANSGLPACLPVGEYRVDLYANGHFAGRGTGKSNWSGLRPLKLNDLQVGFCLPQDQQLVPTKTGAGASAILLGPGLKSGTAIFALPRSLANSRTVAALAQAVTRGFANGLGKLPGLRLVKDEKNIFMNLDSPHYDTWTYNGGTLISGTGLAPNRVFIGMSWGPGNGDREIEIINSFSGL